MARSDRTLAPQIALALLAAAMAAAPVWADANTLRVLGEFSVTVALATLWNLLAGYAGLVSVGQQAFVGIGAYLMLSNALTLGINPLYALPAIGLLGFVASLPIAAIAFRLRGHYFAIGTWAIAEILRLAVMKIDFLGGGSGTSLPISTLKMIASDKTARNAMIYETSFALAVVCVALAFLLLRSRWGVALRAIRDSEIAAGSIGISILPVKFAVYCGVAGLTAIVGGVVLLQKLRVSPESAFSVNDWTASIIFVAVIGGIGTLEGPIIGAIAFFVLRETLSGYGPAYLVILGLIAIVTMLGAPKGIWGYASRCWGLSALPIRQTPPPSARELTGAVELRTPERGASSL